MRFWFGQALRTDRGNSDFDLRHALNASAAWQVPRRDGAGGLRGALGGWSLSGVLRARTGFPITVQQSAEYIGINLINAFRPDYMEGKIPGSTIRMRRAAGA